MVETEIPAIAVAPVSAAVAQDMDSADADEDDDLPRPGKIWDGPSLKDALKSVPECREAIPTPSQTSSPSPETARIANSESDVISLWPQLVSNLSKEFPSMAGVLKMANLDEVRDGQATIRFQASAATFPNVWAKNGKKETIANALSALCGKPIGVRFEVEAIQVALNPPPAIDQPTTKKTTIVDTRPQIAPEPAPISLRPTAEQVELVKADPLIQLALAEFGGDIIRVE